MKIRQVGAESSVHLWSYLLQLFLECAIFRNKVKFFLEKYGTSGQATDDSMEHARCMLDTQG